MSYENIRLKVCAILNIYVFVYVAVNITTSQLSTITFFKVIFRSETFFFLQNNLEEGCTLPQNFEEIRL